jgi:hypothetical protein
LIFSIVQEHVSFSYDIRTSTRTTANARSINMAESDVIYPSALPNRFFYVVQLIIYLIFVGCLLPIGYGLYILMAFGEFVVGNSFILSLLLTLSIWGAYFGLLGWFILQACLCVWRIAGKQTGREPKLFAKFRDGQFHESILLK